MPEEHLSGEEKRARLREEYKRDLTERKRILDELKTNHHVNQATKALQDLERISNTDDTDEWTRRLNENAAVAEAKLDIALEKVNGGEKTLGDESRSVENDTTRPNTTEEDQPRKTLGEREG